MIKRDISYIFKRIIIGIGIILGISFIRSCNVYALENIEYYDPNTDINVSFSLDTNRYPYYFLYRYNINSTTSGYTYNLAYSPIKPAIRCFYTNNNCQNYFNSSVINKNVGFDFYRPSGVDQVYQYSKTYDNNKNLISSTNSQWGSVSLPMYNYETVFENGITSWTTFNKVLILLNFDNTLNGVNISKEYFNENNYTHVDPEIVSLNPVLNKTDDNMLVSVSFSPEFSYIDTENYNYYAWFEGYDKLKLTQNNVKINTQNNTTFYVEITDKHGNSIDTETYTVSSIGLVYNGDYDIQFKTDEYSQSDTENNSDEMFNTINRIDIDILYIPKWLNYKYQYQFVPQNSSITENWVLVNDNNDKNNVVYSASSNGTMYARILDKDNNVLKSETFTITRIGAIKTYDKNTDNFYGMFNTIKETLNFGGPISDLIVIPVNVLQSIVNASNKVCTPYDLGSIGGHHIVFPCIEPEHYLGSALWTTIDLIFSGCMFFAISKWFTSAYYNFILLDNTPGIKERRDLD